MNRPVAPEPPPPTAPRCTAGEPGFAERYRAICARDARFDGQFITAVATTGIYCRPSCPARTPRSENVTFFVTSAAAHEAGYRACKRCLPEATPGTPDWDLRRDLAARAMRLIADGVVDRHGIDGLATQLGYSTRQVHRLLVAELGAGPLALARARRAQTARSLLVGTDLRLADVAFASGFGSVRQFNDTIRDVFATRPGELRARARRRDAVSEGVSHAGAEPPVQVALDLPLRAPFDAPGLFAFLAARAVHGVEAVDELDAGSLRYARTLRLPAGPGAVEVIARPSRSAGWTVQARLELSSLSDLSPAVSRVRRLFDLDADPLAIDAALRTDPALAPSVTRTPGMRVPGAVDSHELLVRAIIGQQISVSAARTHLHRLAEHLGTPYVSTFAGLHRLFPSAAQIAEGLDDPAPGDPLPADRVLRLPRRAIHTVAQTAVALASGELVLGLGDDPQDVRDRLQRRPGLGPWTAAYVSLRVLGDPDAWLSGDVALFHGAAALGVVPAVRPGAAAHRTLADRADAWSPWRSYAALHLWRATATDSTTETFERTDP